MSTLWKHLKIESLMQFFSYLSCSPNPTSPSDLVWHALQTKESSFCNKGSAFSRSLGFWCLNVCLLCRVVPLSSSHPVCCVVLFLVLLFALTKGKKEPLGIPSRAYLSSHSISSGLYFHCTFLSFTSGSVCSESIPNYFRAAATAASAREKRCRFLGRVRWFCLRVLPDECKCPSFDRTKSERKRERVRKASSSPGLKWIFIEARRRGREGCRWHLSQLILSLSLSLSPSISTWYLLLFCEDSNKEKSRQCNRASSGRNIGIDLTHLFLLSGVRCFP